MMANEALDSSRVRGTPPGTHLETYLYLSNRVPALRPFGDFELYTLALLQAAEAACLDSREVHKNIFACLPADKAVAFGVVKPLYCSLFCHFVALYPFRFIYAENSRR